MNENFKVIVNNISRLNKHIFVYLDANVIRDKKIKEAKIKKEEKLEEIEPEEKKLLFTEKVFLRVNF